MARLVVLAWVRWLAGVWVSPCLRVLLGLWPGALLGRVRGLTRLVIGFCDVILEVFGLGVCFIVIPGLTRDPTFLRQCEQGSGTPGRARGDDLKIADFRFGMLGEGGPLSRLR